MTRFDTLFTAADSALRSLHGEPATYKALGQGNGVSVTVIVTPEQPMLVVGDNQGQAIDRVLYLSVLTSAVANPQRSDTYTLTSTAYAGTYTHQKIEKRSGTRWLIAARQYTHGELGAAGAREVKA